MKILGFFEELWPDSPGQAAGKVADFILAAPAPDEARIGDYLDAGYELFTAMGVVGDVLGSDERILGGDSLFTDGEWLWRGDLSFYLEYHHIALPAEFLDQVRNADYRMPQLPHSRLIELTLELSQYV